MKTIWILFITLWVPTETGVLLPTKTEIEFKNLETCETERKHLASRKLEKGQLLVAVCRPSGERA